MGVDWIPENMLVLDDPEKVDDYLKQCEGIDLPAYLGRFTRSD